MDTAEFEGTSLDISREHDFELILQVCARSFYWLSPLEYDDSFMSRKVTAPRAWSEWLAMMGQQGATWYSEPIRTSLHI
jgi:hypothetical protein